jgi:hypothetical protein
MLLTKLQHWRYCHMFMVAWLTMTGFGLDDRIYWHLLLQSLLIKINYNNSQSIFSRPLLPWLPRTRPILIPVLRLLIYDWTTYIVSRRIRRKHIRYPAMDMCEPHGKHLFCCQKCVLIGPLPSNGSTFHNLIYTYPPPLTEMSTRNIKKRNLGGKGRPARRADNLAAIC